MVEVRCFIKDFCGFGEDDEAVGEAFGDPEELEGVWTEVKTGPFAEVGGVGAEIHCDIPDVA